ncbi:MAG: adenylate/guanylate cyclase domain-containing protein [Thaumarchaeota archaeon]|nr:adenylate/guanylate cyclase domain-containing protein [Nitrososphaerota archaeon]
MSTLNVPFGNKIERFRIEGIIAKIRAAVHGEISFCGTQRSYCMGIVDMVNSTKITANLENSRMCEYYRIYLNSMAEIAKEFGAVVIKNIGDSILYYFPDTCDAEDTTSVQTSLECSLAMVESYGEINRLMAEYGLPPVSYRVSSDYGKLTIAKSSVSACEDIFGPTVNTCAKINGIAMPNSTVVGGDLYQIARQFKGYGFHSLVGFSVGVRLDYPVYSLCRKEMS